VEPVTVRFVTRLARAMDELANKDVVVVFVPVALVHVIVVGEKFVAVRFVNLAFVAKRAVLVALVLVVSVKTPVLGVVAPIVMLLMVPPERVALAEERVTPEILPPVIVTLPLVKLVPVRFRAVRVVPEAEA
jgi:hypothetical protein